MFHQNVPTQNVTWFTSDEYLNYVSKIAVDDQKKDQLLSLDMLVQKMIKTNKEINERIQIEDDFNKHMNERITLFKKYESERKNLETELFEIKKKNTDLENNLKKEYSKKDIEIIFGSFKFFASNNHPFSLMIKSFLIRILTWNNFQLLFYSFIPILIVSITCKISSNPSGKFFIEVFSLLLWFYLITVCISKELKISSKWHRFFQIDKFTSCSLNIILMIQYCIGFSILEKTTYFKSWPLLLTNIIVIILLGNNLKDNKLTVLAAILHTIYISGVYEQIAFITIETIFYLNYFPLIIMVLLNINYANLNLETTN